MNGAHDGRSGRRRRARAARLALVALVVLGLAFWGGMRLERFLEVDRCLDAGGRFDHQRGWCER